MPQFTTALTQFKKDQAKPPTIPTSTLHQLIAHAAGSPDLKQSLAKNLASTSVGHSVTQAQISKVVEEMAKSKGQSIEKEHLLQFQKHVDKHFKTQASTAGSRNMIAEPKMQQLH